MASVTQDEKQHPFPAFLFAHGSTMMLGEDTEPAEVWKQAGDEALRHGVERIVLMGAHWDSPGDTITVCTNPKPGKTPLGGVKDSRWQPYQLVGDVEGAERVIKLFQDAGIDARPDPKFDWIHDTYLIIIRMFPDCLPPPTTIISMNARYDPHFHCKMGAALRPLRYEKTLIIGSGGSVHNLYRNHWQNLSLFKDNLAQPYPPGYWALQFRQALEDAICHNRGPNVRRALTRLMKHPRYKEAHGTDDHMMATLFLAGAAGGHEDVTPNVMLGECWELVNMCNSQYQFGSW